MSIRKKPRSVCVGKAKDSYSQKTPLLYFACPYYVVLVRLLNKGFMSNKEAKNKPGLCPDKGKCYGLYSRGKARNHFSRMSAIKEPFHFPPTGPLSRQKLRFQKQWFIYTFTTLTVTSYRGALLQNGQKLRSPTTEPHIDVRLTYI